MEADSEVALAVVADMVAAVEELCPSSLPLPLPVATVAVAEAPTVAELLLEEEDEDVVSCAEAMGRFASCTLAGPEIRKCWMLPMLLMGLAVEGAV